MPRWNRQQELSKGLEFTEEVGQTTWTHQSGGHTRKAQSSRRRGEGQVGLSTISKTILEIYKEGNKNAGDCESRPERPEEVQDPENQKWG